VDGQHTAIAAATLGSIETLPCLVLDAATRAERSAAFVGINRDRVSLTAYALYRARLIAGDPEAVMVNNALVAAGATLHESIRQKETYPPGALACVSTLLQIVRWNGEALLTRVLKVACEAGLSPVPSALIRALAELMRARGPSDAQLAAAIAEIGVARVLARAADRVRAGQALNINSACGHILLDAVSARKAA
jgi:hypothetical protein